MLTNGQTFLRTLGKAKTEITIPKIIRDKRAWKMAHEWITDKLKYEKQWETPTGPPTFEELTEAANKCANDKGVNRDEIPAELWKNSPTARKLLWKMVRKVWTQIQEGAETVEIPADWVDATLVCLYKGKGSRKDPAKHRGISLISIVEKILSILVLNRMKDPVNKIVARTERIPGTQVMQRRSVPAVARTGK